MIIDREPGRDALARAAELLRRAVARRQPVAALTGAGISAESGVPTFRGSGGLWRGFRPEELATPAAFARDPQRVWEWYHWRRGLVLAAEPNPGHRALAVLEDRLQDAFTLITQNVDGLHQRAGSRRVVKLHGNLLEARCTRCGRVEPLAPGASGIPRCPACGAMQRPNVVWFGEPLPGAAWARARQAAATASVFLVIGTSAV
ncbi:MAG TPA: Sir2 family NAD-dependent protein deacetylase, partial [Thermaerobacter sp.]